jgi:hypothetical protein
VPIDGCPYTFEKLAAEVLPKHFASLLAAKDTAHDASVFAAHKSATRKLLSELALKKDIPGCYVFYDGEKPMYVGTSRAVVSRLTQHLSSGSANSATLAYGLAKKDRPMKGNPDTRMADPEFDGVFTAHRDQLRSMRVAFVQISDPVTMYLFEVYAAMKLDTRWNHFRTH